MKNLRLQALYDTLDGEEWRTIYYSSDYLMLLDIACAITDRPRRIVDKKGGVLISEQFSQERHDLLRRADGGLASQCPYRVGRLK